MKISTGSCSRLVVRGTLFCDEGKFARLKAMTSSRAPSDRPLKMAYVKVADEADAHNFDQYEEQQEDKIARKSWNPPLDDA